MLLRLETKNETAIGHTAETSWHDAGISKVYQVYTNTNDTSWSRVRNILRSTKL